MGPSTSLPRPLVKSRICRGVGETTPLPRAAAPAVVFEVHHGPNCCDPDLFLRFFDAKQRKNTEQLMFFRSFRSYYQMTFRQTPPLESTRPCYSNQGERLRIFQSAPRPDE